VGIGAGATAGERQPDRAAREHASQPFEIPSVAGAHLENPRERGGGQPARRVCGSLDSGGLNQDKIEQSVATDGRRSEGQRTFREGRMGASGEHQPIDLTSAILGEGLVPALGGHEDEVVLRFKAGQRLRRGSVRLGPQDRHRRAAGPQSFRQSHDHCAHGDAFADRDKPQDRRLSGRCGRRFAHGGQAHPSQLSQDHRLVQEDGFEAGPGQHPQRAVAKTGESGGMPRAAEHLCTADDGARPMHRQHASRVLTALVDGGDAARIQQIEAVGLFPLRHQRLAAADGQMRPKGLKQGSKTRLRHRFVPPAPPCDA